MTRAADGGWSHPDLPSFDEGDTGKFTDWLDRHQLEPTRVWMEHDDEQLHERYCGGDNDTLANWQPTAPAGAGWFLLALGDTGEDGPVAYFVRQIGAEA